MRLTRETIISDVKTVLFSQLLGDLKTRPSIPGIAGVMAFL